MSSELIEIEGYQRSNFWEQRAHGVDYVPCRAVVRHPLGATAPCIRVEGHETNHEAVFYVRYREMQA